MSEEPKKQSEKCDVDASDFAFPSSRPNPDFVVAGLIETFFTLLFHPSGSFY
jgi:hypothetical protein